MKILHWDEMFHPDFGYQINVLSKFQALQGHDVTIFTSDRIEEHPAFKSFGNKTEISKADHLFYEMYNVRIVRLPMIMVVSGRVIYRRGYIQRIKDFEADVIMCHTNDTISAMNIALKYKSINKPIIFDNHMLQMASTNPLRFFFRLFFRSFITPIIIKNGWTVIRTQDDDYVNDCLGVPKSQTPFISFGSDTTLFNINENIRKNFRSNHGISDDDFVIIYTGKLTEPKGGLFLAEAVLDKFESHKNIVVIVVGNSSGTYGSMVERIFTSSQNRILRFPTQKYTELALFYQASDLSVFPRQCSLSFYDAQACGLPVIAENNNVNSERLSHDNGFTFIKGDLEDFRNKISHCANLPQVDYNSIRENAYRHIVENYDYRDIAEQYTKIFESEYQRFWCQRT